MDRVREYDQEEVQDDGVLDEEVADVDEHTVGVGDRSADDEMGPLEAELLKARAGARWQEGSAWVRGYTYGHA
jgi:hypothetical protein